MKLKSFSYLYCLLIIFLYFSPLNSEEKIDIWKNKVKKQTIKDIENPVEIGLIARSFDACLRCTINFKKSSSKKEIRQVTI